VRLNSTSGPSWDIGLLQRIDDPCHGVAPAKRGGRDRSGDPRRINNAERRASGRRLGELASICARSSLAGGARSSPPYQRRRPDVCVLDAPASCDDVRAAHLADKFGRGVSSYGRGQRSSENQRAVTCEDYVSIRECCGLAFCPPQEDRSAHPTWIRRYHKGDPGRARAGLSRQDDGQR